ncbi:MAG: 3-isopropylmalate dehydrogenase [Myxococcota bacterium]
MPGAAKRIAFIPGDGIGIDVTREALKCLEALRAARGTLLRCEVFDYGAERYLRDGTTLPPGEMERFRDEFHAIFLGALGDPRIPDMAHGRDILLAMRFGLDLYVNLRPVRLFFDRLTPLRGRTTQDIDFVVFRENTEGLYAGVGGFFKKGTPDEVAVNQDINTRKGVERIIRAAFEFARARGKRRVCMSDKSNVLRFAHDLWQRVFHEVAREFPDIEATHLYVDVLAMQMVRAPNQFDVIVTCNMFGDIVSDLGASLVGGLGLAASANLHPGRTSLFEPVHGSAPKHAGKDVANPMAAILTAALMLEHIGLPDDAAVVEGAVRRAIAEGKTTRDLGGELGTRAVGDYVASLIRAS